MVRWCMAVGSEVGLGQKVQFAFLPLGFREEQIWPSVACRNSPISGDSGDLPWQIRAVPPPSAATPYTR